MTIPFYKYQGTGNDFVLIDQRGKTYLKKTDTAIINQLCDRRFGIGADGVMFLENKEGYDFEMVYFNADGSESSMCGNGGRCLTAFAYSLGVFKEKCRFWAIDGEHEALIKKGSKNPKIGKSLWVELKMIDVKQVEIGSDYFLMNTGSPHYVVFVEDLTDIDVYENGRAIRYSERFAKEGVNVNFVEILAPKPAPILKGEIKKGIEVATYERGVEGETFSCGTGVTAAAIAYHLKNGASMQVPITTKGGNLEVKFQKNTEGVFQNVWLCGSATQVFKGQIKI
jgi:diaminopimelate epimerase